MAVGSDDAQAAIRTAAVVATGEELVGGTTVDTNSSWIARKLRPLGVPLVEIRVVSDGLETIRDAVAEVARKVDLLLVTGGLGPTPDDRTRDALAAAAGVPLEEDPQAAALLAAWFARLGRTPSASNARQALLPRGAKALRNERGSAPGIEMSIGRARVIAMPGVPGELRAMVEDAVLPLVKRAATGPAILERVLQVVGLPESVAGERIARWMEREEPPLVSDTVKHGVIRVCAADRDDEAGRARLAECVGDMKAALGDHVFAEGDVSLEEVVVARLRERKESVAIAESCTGGLIAAAITDVPGSSEVFVEAHVVYANEAKVRVLAVPTELIERHGAVSEEVARAMAEGVRARAGTKWGLATTGIAGPAGGSPEKPVGLVHLAVAGPEGEGTRHSRRQLPGDRESVRRFAVIGTLDLLRRALLDSGRIASGQNLR